MHRSPKGWALIAIMTVSVFATMFLFSLAGLSATLLQTDGAARQRNYALAGAEAGLDYARLMLNKSLAEDVPTDIAPDAGERSKVYGVPVQYLPQVGNRCSVMLRITRITPEELGNLASLGFTAIPAGSNLFLTDANSQNWSRYALANFEDSPNGSYAWKVEVTSYCGIFATSIRSVLVAENSEASGGLSPSSRDSGVVGDEGVTFNPPDNGSILVKAPTNEYSVDDQISDTADGAPKSFNAAVRTNGSMTLSPSTTLFSDVVISNPNNFTGYLLNGDPSSKIYGRVTAPESSVSPENFSWNNGSSTANLNDNIVATADTLPSVDGQARVGDNQNPVSVAPESSDLRGSQTPYPVPVPSTTSPLPAFPENPPYPDAAALPNSVTPGQAYVTPSLDSAQATGALNFNQQGAGSPTKIFVVDDSLNPSTDAVNISSKWINNGGNASDLQLYYAGAKPINIFFEAGNEGTGKLNMAIYAPNSTITFKGRGDFTGAVVGQRVNMFHDGSVQIDKSASQVLTKQANNNNPGGNDSSAAPKPRHYTVLTWQQVTGKLVPME